MGELKAVLFDVDGTLAETERHGHLPAFNQAFKEFGLDWHWSAELYGELLAVTGSLERTHHYVKAYNADYQSVNPDLGALLSEVIARKNEIYIEIVDGGSIPLRPGVERVLRETHNSDVRMAIVTTTSHRNVQSLLETNIGGDVMEWFDVVAAGNIVENKKPAADIYRLALKELNLPAENCLAIEDSQNGVQSAQAAGVPCMVISSEYSDGHDLSGAQLIVDEWGAAGLPMEVISGDAGEYAMVGLDLMCELMSRI